MCSPRFVNRLGRATARWNRGATDSSTDLRNGAKNPEMCAIEPGFSGALLAQDMVAELLETREPVTICCSASNTRKRATTSSAGGIWTRYARQ